MNDSRSTAARGQKNVIVVGAGISGLTAAYHLQQAGFAVTVLEASDTVGGRAHTVKKNGYTIDTGASTIAASYHAYIELARELGLADAIVPASQYVGIVRNMTIHYLNTNNIYLSGLRTGLLSWRAKLRLAFAFIDVFLAKRRGQLTYIDLTRAAPLDFETALAYSQRRLNTELATYFSEPLVRGMMLTNSDKISKVELLHGLNNIFDVKLFGLRGGVKRFSERLAQRLDVRLSTPVTAVRRLGDTVEVTWLEHGQLVADCVDACVMACPLPAAASIYPDHQALQALHRKLRFGRCITVAVGMRKRPLSKAYILEVPRAESEDICFTFLEHNKVKEAAPEACGLIMLYLEDVVSAQLMDCSDEEIVARAVPFVEKLMPEVAGSVEMTHVTRWRWALPLNEVGAYQAVADFNAALSPDDPIQFACDYMMAAVGQSIAVECGKRASTHIIQKLAKTAAQ